MIITGVAAAAVAAVSIPLSSWFLVADIDTDGVDDVVFKILVIFVDLVDVVEVVAKFAGVVWRFVRVGTGDGDGRGCFFFRLVVGLNMFTMTSQSS